MFIGIYKIGCVWQKTDGTFTYELLDDGTYGVKASNISSNITEITIPSTYKGLPVTVVLKGAFRNITTLEKVIIPEGVSTIESYAFYSCSALTDLTIPKSIKYINAYAFYSCAQLTDVWYNGSVNDKSFITIGANQKLSSGATWHYIQED